MHKVVSIALALVIVSCLLSCGKENEHTLALPSDERLLEKLDMFANDYNVSSCSLISQEVSRAFGHDLDYRSSMGFADMFALRQHRCPSGVIKFLVSVYSSESAAKNQHNGEEGTRCGKDFCECSFFEGRTVKVVMGPKADAQITGAKCPISQS